ncbi:TetR/AcrR family transcriptional regulator, transcriptional repressor for nem operon [Paenibacillus catalpae]|uniref:TetR/AcrR family transcriptional regulator, transcriptional repressor for nem operon n=1 Tax=Paenibacillus catalpae TaxID=1045775 RepID=A0A1I1V393_9BACL|nr:TetR/AcrR family transcriptional regulator [Paenibacillus catalpae]SFD76478.1 TetR/AcrR family transcriptional regulator, transcriptional repressor for nem operon [Paenibacillus catalpae]
MARPREFDQDAVLQKAMELFWQKGYERTSIQDLVEHTGVHRGSLYDTFGDKNQLFLTCLDRFRDTTKNRAHTILEEDGPAKDVLGRYFERLIDIAMSDDNGRRGCLIANTAMEMGKVDPVVSFRIEAYTLDMEMNFHKFLMRAKQRGELKTKHTVQEAARFLLNTRNGLYVLAKIATDRKVLEDAAKVAMSILV